MKAHLIKYTAVLLSLFMLAQSSLPTYAQAYTDSPFWAQNKGKQISFDEKKFSVNAKFFTIGNTLSFDNYKFAMSFDKDLKSFRTLSENEWQDLYFEYKKAVVAEEDAVSAAYNHIKKIHKYGPDDAVYIAQSSKFKNKNGDICDNGKCFDPLIYNRALLRALLRYGAGLDETNKKWRWNNEIMLASAKNIYDVLSEYGISVGDVGMAQKYFRQLINKTGDYCDNDIYMADIMPGLAGGSGRADARKGKEERRSACEKLGYIALSLGMLDELSAADKNENAELLYRQLKNNYREDYGALVLGNYVTALLISGNNKAYQLLEKFLLKDSLSDGLRVGNVWQILGRTFDIISIKAWVDKTTDINNRIRGRGGRYLNEVGLRFQYIDEETARKYGYSNFSISIAKDGHSGYNMPYGNLLEDIGVLLSQWPDSRARSIAKKAVNNYAFALRSSNNGYAAVHIPLVTGAIKGGGVKGGNSSYVIGKLYSLDWWDLNEGTQRRVNNIMAQVSKSYGAGYRPEKTKNAIKISRAEKNQRIAQLAVWGDILVSAVLMTAFIVSLPSLAKGTSSFIKSFRASRALRSTRIAKIRGAGKGALLKQVHKNIRKSGVTPVKRTGNAGRQGASVGAAAQNTKAAAQNGKNTAKTLSSMAEKHRKATNASSVQRALTSAEKSSLNKGTAQIVLSEGSVKASPVIEGRSAVLTATVGEGGGGAAATQGTGKLTRAQRLLISQRQAESDLKIAQEALELSQPGVSAPFKPGWFFNKPYKQLPKWKRFVADQYFSWILPSWDIGGQIAKGSIRNPGKAFSGLTLTGAPSVNLFSPTVIVAPVSQGPQTALRTAYNLSDAFGATFNITKITPTLTTVEVFANTSKAASAAASGVQKGALGSRQIFSVFALPKIEGILNEFHGGPSARFKTNYSSNYYFDTPAAKISPAETKAQEPISPAVSDAQIQSVQEIVGYDEFEYFASQLLKKRSIPKANKARYQELQAAARYISPKLISELLDIIDQNPYGHQTFDMYMDEIAETLESLKSGEVITLSGYRIPSVKAGALEDWQVRNSLVIEDNPLEDMFAYVSSSGNFMVKSALKRALTFPAEKQKGVLKNLVDIQLSAQEAGAPKRSYLVGITGDTYEWEDFSNDNVLTLALGKEIKKDLYKELSVNKGKERYSSLLSKYKEWLISVLGATKNTPAVWFENSEGTVFIYSHDGQVRIRVGGHELLLARKTNFHLHLEYRNAIDGNWNGPTNYNYAWFNQNMLPSDVFKDMIQTPIAYMTSKGILIKKENLVLNDTGAKDEGGESDIYFLSNSQEGSKEALKLPNDEIFSFSDLQSKAKGNIASAKSNTFLWNFKGSENSLIPNLTSRSLSYVPYDKIERQIFYNLIKINLANIFGTPDYLDSWRKKMYSYDVSPYKQSIFSVISKDRYNGTAFITEYLGMKFLLTNRHVVDNAKQVKVFDEDYNMFEADVIAKTTDREGMDLALLLPKDAHILDKYKPLPLSLKPMPETGGGLYTLGYPGNGYRFIKKPLLMLEQDKTSKYPLINVLPSVLSGTSGSPLMLPSSEKGKDGVAGIAHTGGRINSFFIPTLTIKSFLKKTIKLGLSDPYFDNNIFYNAGLFKGYDSFRQKFLLDDSFWYNNLLRSPELPSYGFEHGRKIDDIYIPLILMETNPNNIPLSKDNISDEE